MACIFDISYGSAKLSNEEGQRCDGPQNLRVGGGRLQVFTDLPEATAPASDDRGNVYKTARFRVAKTYGSGVTAAEKLLWWRGQLNEERTLSIKVYDDTTLKDTLSLANCSVSYDVAINGATLVIEANFKGV